MTDRKASLGLATLALLSLAAGSAAADSLWQGNDTLYRLIAEGTSRSFVVERPDETAGAAGWAAGEILFRGVRDGNTYVGTVYGAGGTCTQKVRGRVASEVSVVFDIVSDAACIGLEAGALALRYVGDAGAAPATERAGAIKADPSAADVPAETPLSEAPEPSPEPAQPEETPPEADAPDEASAQPTLIASGSGSLWQAGDMVLRLLADGRGRQFVIERPGVAARSQGWRTGDILFDGVREGDTYLGTLFGVGGRCGETIQGRVREELVVELPAQSRTDCAGAIAGPLNLRFIAKAGDPLPAGLLSRSEDGAELGSAAERTPEVDDPEPEAGDRPSQAAATPAAQMVADASDPVAALPGAGTVPPAACVPEAQSNGLSLAACEGILSGLRVAAGADPALEAARSDAVLQARGAPLLHPAVDAACYADASLSDQAEGLELARTQASTSERLLPLCLRMISAATAVPAPERLAIAAAQSGAISGAVWVSGEKGGDCKGQKVLRLTSEGLFEGRYGNEVTPTNLLVTAWTETADRVTARMEIYSQIASAPDVVLDIDATRIGAELVLTLDRQLVSSASRYSNAPEYSADRMTLRYAVCRP